MIKVKDIGGRELPGLFRTERGTLVVNNDDEFAQYNQRLADKTRIANLESDVSEIKELLKQLLAK